MRALAAIALFACASGCATGSVSLVGKPRPPIAPGEVLLLADPPAEYDVIAVLEVSAEMGWTPRARQEMAVAYLRERAAGLGANGILFTETGDPYHDDGAGLAVPAGAGVGFSFGAVQSTDRVFAKAIRVREP